MLSHSPLCLFVNCFCACMCDFVCLGTGLQAKLAVMAAQSSRELWEAAALLGSVSCSAGGWTAVRRAVGIDGREGGCRLERREGGIDKISVCVPGWLAAGGTSAGPVPQTPTPLPHFTIPASLRNQWWTDGLEKEAEHSQFRPTAACFIGPSLGIIVIELWKLSLQTDIWQEVGTAGLHTTTDVWPSFPPSSPTTPFL